MNLRSLLDLYSQYQSDEELEEKVEPKETLREEAAPVNSNFSNTIVTGSEIKKSVYNKEAKNKGDSHADTEHIQDSISMSPEKQTVSTTIDKYYF